ncbi:hypothetical protein T492DRAFT_851200, partial [Pavlovales sp. CCMP2436]
EPGQVPLFLHEAQQAVEQAHACDVGRPGGVEDEERVAAHESDLDAVEVEGHGRLGGLEVVPGADGCHVDGADEWAMFLEPQMFSEPRTTHVRPIVVVMTDETSTRRRRSSSVFKITDGSASDGSLASYHSSAATYGLASFAASSRESQQGQRYRKYGTSDSSVSTVMLARSSTMQSLAALLEGYDGLVHHGSAAVHMVDLEMRLEHRAGKHLGHVGVWYTRFVSDGRGH